MCCALCFVLRSLCFEITYLLVPAYSLLLPPAPAVLLLLLLHARELLL